MECNKEEAVRAKIIAENKFSERDLLGAKKFALKAHGLYPGLDGISQMLTTLDVHIAAKNKIIDEPDWYGILGVTTSADDETVKRQYRKLALMLHPDKNKSVGADDAFRLVSEAWTLLSDKSKRVAYNQKRNLKGFQQKVPTQKVPESSGKTQMPTTRVASTPVAPPRPDTFWTVCNKCKMQYEYLRIYLNQTLLCPNCHEAFMALETPPPKVGKMSNLSSRQHQNRNHPVFGAQKPASVGPTGFNSSNNAKPNFGPRAGPTVANEKMKRERDVSSSSIKGERPLKTAKGMENVRTDGAKEFVRSVMKDMANKRNEPVSRSRVQVPIPETVHRFPVVLKNSRRELSMLETRNMLMHRAKMEIRKMQSEWTKAAEKERERTKEQKKPKPKGMVNGDSHMLNPGKKPCPPGPVADDVSPRPIVPPTTMNVPDSDFHDFDKDRTEGSFRENQVWATYDDDDGMPRYYCMIHKVISLKPFRVKLSWLNSKSNTEFSELDWIGSGFPKTSGDFRIGKHVMNQTLNSFSHKINKWEKGLRGAIRILPRKGEVWALYRNWSSDWNEQTLDDVIHKYDMVEVVKDYSEEDGVSVTPLFKVSGFRTVFYHRLDPEKVRRIPKKEMFRFSHQVPNYLLTGEEGKNAPKGCQELDPAATPLELLQVITDPDEREIANGGNFEKVLEEVVIENGSKSNAPKPMEVECGDC